MQISGANLLIAAQNVQAPAPAAAPGFASMLSKAAGFTPRDLSRPEPVAPQPPAQPATGRPGMTIDIKV